MDNSARYLPEDWVVPAITAYNREFFTSGEMRIQKCLSCGSVQHPPLDVCNVCQAFEFEYVTAAPHGVIDSYTIVHHPVHVSLNDRVPYNVCVIALADYPQLKIVGNVIDAPPAEIGIGRRVTATWAVIPGTEDQPEIILPQWKLVTS
jgi:uncharacterized OB-fold protein